MKHTTKIELTNLADLTLANEGFIYPKDVRRVTVEDALVNTEAMWLSLPKPLIEQLGLTPFSIAKRNTAAGTVARITYSTVQFTLLERNGILPVTDLPADAPVLVGQMVLEQLDLCLDIKKGVIYKPNPGNDWIVDAW